MRKLIFIIPIALLGLLFTGCGSVTHVSTLSPDKVFLQVNMSDLEFLGETEVSISYTYYLGLFTKINEVNGTIYDPVNRKITKLDGKLIDLGKQLDRATYKVLEEYPKATYFQVVYKKTSIDKLFLGKEVKQSALIRAYSFK